MLDDVFHNDFTHNIHHGIFRIVAIVQNIKCCFIHKIAIPIVQCLDKCPIFLIQG